MENLIKLGFKKYQIVHENEDGSTILVRKGKTFKLLKFNVKSPEFYSFVRKTNKLENSGIKVLPIVKKIDKEGLVLLLHKEGTSVIDILKNKEMNDEIYKAIFVQSYLARVNKITISYDPEDYLWDGNKLYYKSTYYDVFDESKLFIKEAIRYWFDTKELEQLMKSKNIDYKRENKEDYVVNKEIVLKTAKYYY